MNELTIFIFDAEEGIQKNSRHLKNITMNILTLSKMT